MSRVDDETKTKAAFLHEVDCARIIVFNSLHPEISRSAKGLSELRRMDVARGRIIGGLSSILALSYYYGFDLKELLNQAETIFNTPETNPCSGCESPCYEEKI